MNRSNEKNPDSSDTLSAAYRAIATEHAPEHLDRDVLRRARKELSAVPGGGWLTARIRPLAFVVTAGLSLALLVQLSETPFLETPPVDPVTPTQPDDLFQDAARQTAEQIRQLDTRTERPMTSPGANASPQQSPEVAAAPSQLPAEDRCAETDRAESGRWWECIRNLEKRGLSESAERELQALLKAYPRFSAPQ